MVAGELARLKSRRESAVGSVDGKCVKDKWTL